MLISDKINFKPKIVIRDKEAHCIDMTKHSVYQESITIVHIYALASEHLNILNKF